MAQVLPSIYDSFTRGRKDAIEFQNLLTAQRQAALTNPLDVLYRQGNVNLQNQNIDTQTQQNTFRRDTMPGATEATNTGNAADTVGNINRRLFGLDVRNYVDSVGPDPMARVNANTAGTPGQQAAFLNPPSTVDQAAEYEKRQRHAWLQANGYYGPQTNPTDVPNPYAPTAQPAPASGQPVTGPTAAQPVQAPGMAQYGPDQNTSTPTQRTPPANNGAYPQFNLNDPYNLGDGYMGMQRQMVVPPTPLAEQAKGLFAPNPYDPVNQAGNLNVTADNFFAPNPYEFGTPPVGNGIDFERAGKFTDLYNPQPDPIQQPQFDPGIFNPAPVPLNTGLSQLDFSSSGLSPELIQYALETDRLNNLPPGTTIAKAGIESEYGKNNIGPMTKWGTAKGPMQMMDNTVASLNKMSGQNLDPMNFQQALMLDRQLLEDNKKFIDPTKDPYEEQMRLYQGGNNRAEWGANNAIYPALVSDRLRRFLGGS